MSASPGRPAPEPFDFKWLPTTVKLAKRAALIIGDVKCLRGRWRLWIGSRSTSGAPTGDEFQLIDEVDADGVGTEGAAGVDEGERVGATAAGIDRAGRVIDNLALR